MKTISLSLPIDARKSLKKNSILNNFPLIDYFYFIVPLEINEIEQANYVKHGISFFSDQLNIPFENLISINDDNNQDVILTGKKLPWDIFYQYDCWIQVKTGVFDDEIGLDISGFIGKIIGFFSDGYQNLFQIAFSGESISKLPITTLKSIKTSPFFTILETDLILPSIQPDDIRADENLKLEIAREEFKQENIFPNFESEDSKFYGFYRLIKDWEQEFNANFPKNGNVKIQTASRKVLCWTGIANSDDNYGVWGEFEKDEILLPLTEIEKIFENKRLTATLINYKNFAKKFLPN